MYWYRDATVFIFAAPFCVMIIGFEIVVSHLQNFRCYTIKDTLTSCYLLVLNILLDTGMRAITFASLYYFSIKFRILELDNSWAYWITLLFLQDLAFYFLHLFEHRCRAFWAVHVTHHSSEEFNLTIGFRSSVFQPLYQRIVIKKENTWVIMLLWDSFRIPPPKILSIPRLLCLGSLFFGNHQIVAA